MDFKQEKLPLHVAIIMDGNGRWALQRNLPRLEGHMAGIESVRETVTATREIGIPYLTLYAFSKENWSRPKEEVHGLLQLLELYLQKELPMMMEHEIRFQAIGALNDLPKKLQAMLNDVMQKTGKHEALTLNIALSYSGREEIVQAVRSLVQDTKAGRIKRINERVFARYLYTAAIPDPDLLIRTSGEMRLSNFLLWQMAYTEIYVTETLWPDFRREAYEEALLEFTRRERRFGSLKEY
ncbi:MAG TPA: isoprenyl transferase [Syntrophorhabdales bacterium]|nr:isoprenyl transferase [Syntrophorhabdales bacterium]